MSRGKARQQKRNQSTGMLQCLLQVPVLRLWRVSQVDSIAGCAMAASCVSLLSSIVCCYGPDVWQ
jgi:hypothetical protein